MFAQINRDVVVTASASIAGIRIPTKLANVPLDRLRFDGAELKDAASVSSFAIDGNGIKHLPGMAETSWQVLECNFEDRLERDPDTGLWEVAGTGVLKADVDAEARRRVQAVMSRGKMEDKLFDAVVLLVKGESSWTPEDRDAVQELVALADTRSQILAAQQALKEMTPIPANYEDDTHWP